jgi:hypothetical protein
MNFARPSDRAGLGITLDFDNFQDNRITIHHASPSAEDST